MSIVINGMEMPVSCTRCPCSDDETRFCNAAKKYIPMYGKPKFCPLATIEERKTGKWEERKVSSENAIDEWQSARCSVCGKYHTTPYMYYFDDYSYCPNCGARMEGEE